ncbi:metallopeptidase TldD-related protein [Streptomyces sp. MK7]|uniref:metallopeptidase TldD-related protein n=1 Tax=Streptomyces sp. MK7 TaxID=3067635 RepID=UPI0029300A3B|nr:metallopeptidase TldD-related protein [Streptomyces sp. MK7]
MSIDPRQVRSALDIMGRGAHVDLSQERTGLLRYARSQVTAQHSEERLRVRVRLTEGGRTALGTLETLEPTEVRALSDRLRSALALLPAPSGEPDAFPRSAADPVAPEVGTATLSAGPAERHAWFSAVRDGLADTAQLGGSIRHDVIHRVVADHSGLYREETLTKASLQAIAERDGRSSSVRVVHRDAARIDPTDVARRLLDDLTDLPERESVSGTFRVLLRPQAVITLLATYGYVALGAAGYAEGRTAVAGRIGSRVTSDLLTLTDDGTDQAGLASGFDPEGTPRRPTRLIDRGVLTGVVSDLKHADVTDGSSTGHAVPAGWRFGADPSPSHLFLAGGDRTEEELAAVCGTGLVISRLDYLRILHPKDTLVTGTTRDTTYWIHDCEPVAWQPSVRLTFRMDEVLDAVLAVGSRRERGEAVFMESVVAPALLVEAGPISL